MIGAIARWFGYSTWFMVALAASLYWSVPKDDMRRLVQHKASQKLKTKVTIDKIALHGLTGVSLLGLQVVLPISKAKTTGETGAMPGAPAADKTPGSDAEAPETAAEPPPLPVDMPGLLIANSVRVDVNTFGLLVGKKLLARLTAEISGGSISDTTFAVTPDGWSLHVGAIDGVDLGPIRMLRTLAKMDLDMSARLSGKADLEWGGSLENSRGEIELTLNDTVLPYLPIKDPRQPFPLGEAFEVQLGTIELQATLDKPDKLQGVRARPGSTVTLLLEKLSAQGEHLELQLDGGQKHTISFVGKQTGDAEVDITLVVSFTDAFFEWTGVGHRPNGDSSQESHAGLKMALEAGLRSARTVIGARSYYGFHCQGRLRDFKCLPKAPSRRLTPVAPTQPQTPPPNDGSQPIERPSPSEGDDSAAANPSQGFRPARPGTRPNAPSPRLAQPQPGIRPAPRFVEPTRPATDGPLEAARAGGVSGAPGNTLGPGVGGGSAPEPELEPEPPPPEEPVAEEAVPEPAELLPEGEEAPADGGVPLDEGVDGADGVDVEGAEPLPEDEVE